MGREGHRYRTNGSVAIYALCEPDGEVRYVGKTAHYLHVRHKAHIRSALKGRTWPVCRWLLKKINAGAQLPIRLIEYVAAGADWAAREKFWIAHYRENGRLLNISAGGDGLTGYSPSVEARLKMGAARRAGATFPCQVCGTTFWRKPRDIKKGHNKFCSVDCSNGRFRGPRLPL